ncbi:DNA-directed DNA polymerase I [Ignisphaera sp. 4213-co]|uniref:DNA polymerase n=1 Tax=Ignisphaera cupida TaxID=3050454 RepID=A0ABD4Z682_9CREN|nr:DNA-directed DNA polymerase I [Ignisphaera sp. 4213-co]MDK6028410.1 DNA-directed DNA polymerase I [Ignisphaera sp. 4213-co]
MGKNKSLLDFISKKSSLDTSKKDKAYDTPSNSSDSFQGTNNKFESQSQAETIHKELQERRSDEYISKDESQKVLGTSILNIVIPSNININEPIKKTFFKRRLFVDTISSAYLLQVDYDGDAKKALLIFYDPQSHKLMFLYDKTGHKPYFLTDISIDKFNDKNNPIIKKIISHPSFDHVEVVDKIDLLYNVKRTLTKVVTKDPLAVRTLRERVAKAWEADIRYHINYIYDNLLVPGFPYSITGAEFKELSTIDNESIIENLKKDLGIDDEELMDVAIHFLKLFEVKWFSPRRLAIDIEVYTPFEGRIPSPEAVEYPIMSIAVASNDGLKKVFVLYRENLKAITDIPNDIEIEIYDSERNMISDFIYLIQDYPIILTFNGDNFDFRYLFARAIKLDIDKELLGIEIRKVVKGSKTEFEAKLRTSLHIDLYKFFSNKAIQTYAFEARYKEANLDSIAQALLGVGKVQLDEDLSKVSLGDLVRYNFRDAQITLELTTFSNELVWKLILLLMRISKLGLEDLVRSTVSIWIKNLFYWEHRRRGYLIPRKDDILRLKSKKVTEAIIKGKKYAGAIVMEPPQGIFFNVVVLDFASLYPSIMKRWNLSYETIDPDKSSCHRIGNIVDENDKVIHQVCLDKSGITAAIVGMLRDFRVKIYKKKAKDRNLDDATRSWYDVVQRAMKVFINAAYGVFGAETFSLYAPSVAESVTATGRRVIIATRDKALELGLHVLYGDTDSLFIWNPDENKLNELREWVEKTFGLELETDKTYKFVAFPALKKNYVGILTSGEIDVKGMVGKKRNTPNFIKQLFSYILKQLSTIEEPEDAFKVINEIRNELEKHYILLKYKLITLDEIAFQTTLSKPLTEYKKNTPQHVKAALMLQRYGLQISSGDVITYIKTKTKEGVKPIQLAKITELDVQKYVEAMKTSLEQLFTALNISWEEIIGGTKIS